MVNFLTHKRVADLYGLSNKSILNTLEEQGVIPESRKHRQGALYKKGWTFDQLPDIGRHVGFIKKPSRPVSMCVFTTKGGVLKSTLALNLARVSALHGLKTCVVGLDIQGDITTALGHENDLDNDDDTLDNMIDKLNATKGLYDVFTGQSRLNDVIVEGDLPNLFLIPETPELVALNDSLNNINRREFWLKEKVVEPLKQYFDVVIMDCSPNWNRLTTNALVGCDGLVSPLECKINNFRNFKVFRHFLNEFREEMRMDFETIFVPTRFSQNRKLSLEIKSWYLANVPGCSSVGIKESVLGEEATALNRSIVEHAATKDLAGDVREIVGHVFDRLQDYIERHPELPPQEDASYLSRELRV